jgi:hypothetical protein
MLGMVYCDNSLLGLKVWFAEDEEAKKGRGCSLGSNSVDGVK